MLVQSQESARDTAWLLELAAAHAPVLGVVGWADLTDPGSIDGLAGNPWLKGLRPMVQDKADDWLDDPALEAGLARMAERGLVLDALVRPRHLPSLERLARRHPALSIVIDHGAKPDIAHGALDEWQAAMTALASLPNLSCKLSGLLTEARPGQETDVGLVAAWLLDTFGAERLLWGSDWPVLNLAGTYEGWLRLARAVIPAESHGAVFGENARRIYRL